MFNRCSLLVLCAVALMIFPPQAAFARTQPSICSWHVVAGADTGFDGNELVSVSALSHKDAWAGGFAQDNFSGYYWPLLEHWDGSAWSVVASPQPANTTINGVVALSSNDVWAVGTQLQNDEYFTLIMHWDGKSWSVIPTPDTNSNYDDLRAVAANAANDVWAVGYYGAGSGYATLSLHWDGSVWSIVPSPNAPNSSDMLFGIATARTRDVWAVGGSSRTQTLTLGERWSGETWRVHATPNDNGSNVLTSASAITHDDVWALGQVRNPSPVTTLAEHWNGVAWSIVPTPTVSGFDTLIMGSAAVSATDVWAVGYNATDLFRTPTRTFSMHWDGAAWTAVATPDIGNLTNRLLGVGRIPRSNNVWAVGFHSIPNFRKRTTTMEYHC